jgi:hypothetical protein
MSTTLLFVEILLIGLQSGVWIIFLVLVLWGNDFLKLLENVWLSDVNIAIGLVIISFLYTIGIVIDRLADTIFERWYSALKNKIFPNRKTPTQKMRFELSKSNPELSNNMYYARSRIRIARASAINFTLITTLSLIYVITRIPASTNRNTLAVYIVVIGAALTASIIWSWKKLSVSFLYYLKNYDDSDNSQLEKKTTKNNGKQKPGSPIKKAG